MQSKGLGTKSPFWGVVCVSFIACRQEPKDHPPAPAPSEALQVAVPSSGEQRVVEQAAVRLAQQPGVCQKEWVERLLPIAARCPQHEELSETLTRALIPCQEWSLLERHLRKRWQLHPDEALRLRLARVLIHDQRFSEALQLLDGSEPVSAERAWLVGYSLFHLGRDEQARKPLETAEAHRTRSGKADALELLGLVALHQDRLEDAQRLFERAIAVDARSIPAHHGLGRTLVRRGELPRAERVLQTARELQRQRTEEEARALRLSALSRAAHDAEQAGDLEKASTLLEQMLPLASSELRPELLSWAQRVESALETKGSTE